MIRDPAERFSDRVENYSKYRPSYPDNMLRDLLALIEPPASVADVGSGTGILTRQLLDYGYKLCAVEPNEPMRTEAERRLSYYPSFRSVRGTAEATTLDPKSVDLITCAQAFHWFNPAKTRLEFSRILKATGLTALIWNERVDGDSPVNREYDKLLLRMAPEYQNVIHRRVSFEEIQTFFAPEDVQCRTFPNHQILDRTGFLGRLLSSSYVPNLGRPGHSEIMDAAAKIFDRYNLGGQIKFDCQTKLYLGRFSGRAAAETGKHACGYPSPPEKDE